MASVMASCGAMGMSCATSAFDHAHRLKLKGAHTSISGWVPPDDKPVRQTIVYVSMVVYYSLHMLLVGFGVSCLFSLSPWVVSLGVLGGHFIVYTLIRLLINKGDLRLWLKSTQGWQIPSLHGNLDAHRAFLVTHYPEFHLPWERIKSWLIEKTADFQNDPPLWLSHKWLKLIPTKIRNEIWKTHEFKELQDAITDADENGNTEARKKAANIFFID
eukprot:g504.t1